MMLRKPRKPPNGFILFNKSERMKVKSELGVCTPSEVSQEVGRRWKLLELEKKEEFMKASLSAKVEYNVKLSSYFSLMQDPLESSKPRRTANGFILFCKAYRGLVAKELKGNVWGKLSKEMAHRWRMLTHRERQEFMEESRKKKSEDVTTMEENRLIMDIIQRKQQMEALEQFLDKSNGDNLLSFNVFSDSPPQDTETKKESSSFNYNNLSGESTSTNQWNSVSNSDGIHARSEKLINQKNKDGKDFVITEKERNNILIGSEDPGETVVEETDYSSIKDLDTICTIIDSVNCTLATSAVDSEDDVNLSQFYDNIQDISENSNQDKHIWKDAKIKQNSLEDMKCSGNCELLNERKNHTDDMDFDGEDSVPEFPTPFRGTRSGNFKGSARKRTASLDMVVTNLRKHMIEERNFIEMGNSEIM